MSKHTPGPWTIHTKGKVNPFYSVVTSEGGCIALPFDNQEADARLIVVSPDLLERLEKTTKELAGYVECLRDCNALSPVEEILQMIDENLAVIRAAKGTGN